MFIKNTYFASIENFLNYFLPWDNYGLNHGNYIYRGHSKTSYKLIPNVLRPENRDSLLHFYHDRPEEKDKLKTQLYAEINIINSFFKIADRRGLKLPVSHILRKGQIDHSWILSIANNNGVWLPDDLHEIAALAQHYGIPTRFLDWSHDPFVAIYFALENATAESDIHIWKFDTEKVRLMSMFNNELKLLKFITPPYYDNPNLNAQQGLFTHFETILSSDSLSVRDKAKVDRRPLDERIYNSIDDEFKQEQFFECITLEKGCAGRALKYLKDFGYGPSRIYPGYKGVADEAKRMHFLDARLTGL
ncbi:FRG domain-containing protein [Leclercia sp. EC_58]|uniref:FRG domain-containing protein n=1 Tax=Leclercia sp. EC_58 TaxID=2584090 RepID=UPI001C70A3DF|nr:FRG domain-containing protein [Leclercia sp. EC_58]MBW9400667.1 FRG domain-containing protein [Leclercia sp. EC_58]